jgi:hypothetical protein
MATSNPPGMYTANSYRIMTLILEWSSFGILRANVISRGFWQMCLTRR